MTSEGPNMYDVELVMLMLICYLYFLFNNWPFDTLDTMSVVLGVVNDFFDWLRQWGEDLINVKKNKDVFEVVVTFMGDMIF